jgi:hypothetical protein
MQMVGLSVKSGEELIKVSDFLSRLEEIADKAGGEEPKPSSPDITFLKGIKQAAGNEQLIAIFNQFDTLSQNIKKWTELGKEVSKRWVDWNDLIQLEKHALELKEADTHLVQVGIIRKQRQLLEEPNPVIPLVNNLTQLLREKLNLLDEEYKQEHKKWIEILKNDSNWQQLEPEEKNQLLSEQKLTISDKPVVNVKTTDEVLNTLKKLTLSAFADRLAAIPTRFNKVLEAAAELCEPEIQFISIPCHTLTTSDEIEEWIGMVKERLMDALQDGPVQFKKG